MGLREVKSLPKVTQLGKGQSQHWIQSFWLQVAVPWVRAGGGSPGLWQASLASKEKRPLFS